MRVDFEDGGWAEIHSATEMPRRVTVRLQEILLEVPEEQTSWQSLRLWTRLRATLMAMVVKGWSYGEPPGDNAEGLDDMPQGSYDKLKDETREHWRKAGFTESERTEEESQPPTKTSEPTTSSD